MLADIVKGVWQGKRARIIDVNREGKDPIYQLEFQIKLGKYTNNHRQWLPEHFISFVEE